MKRVKFFYTRPLKEEIGEVTLTLIPKCSSCLFLFGDEAAGTNFFDCRFKLVKRVRGASESWGGRRAGGCCAAVSWRGPVSVRAPNRRAEGGAPCEITLALIETRESAPATCK